MKELIDAIHKENLDVIDKILKKKINLNFFTKGINPLLCACMKKNVKIIETLLEHGANPNFLLKDGYTVLMHASINNNHNIVELLLKNNADPNIQNNDKWTALMLAVENAQYNNVKILLNHKADPNIQNKDKWNALFISSELGYSKITKALLLCGANPNICTKSGWTPMLCASKSGHLQIVKLLLSFGANPNPLKKKSKHIPVLIAAKAGYKDVVKVLLDAGANVNVKDTQNLSLLDICKTPNIPIMVKKSNISKIEKNIITKLLKPKNKEVKVEQVKQSNEKQYSTSLCKNEIIGASSITLNGIYKNDFKVSLLDEQNNIHLQIIVKTAAKHLVFTSYENGKKGIDEVYTGKHFPLIIGGPLKMTIEINSHFFNIKFSSKQQYKFKCRMSSNQIKYLTTTELFELNKN